LATARGGTYDGARTRSRTTAQNVLHILLTVAAAAGLASRTPTYKEVPA
jgi:hypothetical protein